MPRPGDDAPGTGRLMALAQCVNANSDWNRREVLSWYCSPPREVSVIYYGSAVGAEPSPAPVMDGPYILCAARLAEYKGLDVLAMAFAELAAATPGIRLVLCGADHSEGGFQRFISSLGLEDRVAWLGQRSHAEVLALMRGCLFFVLPSRRESLGGAVIEAMAAGKAVVATRVGGIPELVRDGVEGLLVEPRDVRGLAAALSRLAREPGVREEMGARGLERSRLFTWEKAIDSYLELYAAHPGARGGDTVACVLWDSDADATALAMAGNLARGLRRRSRRFCLCLRRGRAAEPFRTFWEGASVYRLGLPGAGRWGWADALVALVQLWWIRRREGVGLWHYFVIRYRQLGALSWFARLAGLRPVVSLY